MRKLILVSVFFIASNVYAQKSETIYLDKLDSSQNYYTTLLPDSTSKGLLIILGGFCTNPASIQLETKLPEVACRAGYTVVMPYLIDDCTMLEINSLFQKRLTELIPSLINKYHIPPNKFILGGQSLGGHRALLYTELAYKLNEKRMLKPNLVFGVDPPLNMKRLWYSFTYGVKIKFSNVSVAEGTEMLRRFKIQYRGTPSEFPKEYERASSFYPDAKNGGNAQYLKSIPVRLYCDPDINWIIENRRGNYETMNAMDLSGCISQLKLLGNKNAEFVNCLGKGFKPDGTRHPHYFSMLDPDEFVLWANKMLNN